MNFRDSVENFIRFLKEDIEINRDTKYSLFMPEYRLAINCRDTIQDYEPLINKLKHQDETLDAIKNNIRLIHIFEYEWKDSRRSIIIKKLLAGIICYDQNTVLYARKLGLIENVGLKPAGILLENNHLQGDASAQVRFGLCNGNDLIGIMTFDRSRFNSEFDYELIRLAWKQGTVVKGGAERLFKAFIRKYNPDRMISYCDISKFSGNVYTRLGFKLDKREPISDPNYMWVDPINNIYYPRYKVMKHKLLARGWGTKDQTENEIMRNHGFYKIYNSGNYRFIWDKGEN